MTGLPPDEPPAYTGPVDPQTGRPLFTQATLDLMIGPEGEPLQIDPVDAHLLALATKRMKALVHGNGAKAEDVMLEGFDGAIINFDARTLFEIRHQIAHKSVPGKQGNAEVVGSTADLHMRIQTEVEKTTKNSVIVNYATDVLEKRADKGFAVNNLVIKLDRLNKSFVHHNSCNPCSGTGKLACGPCNGDGRLPCHRCRGQRTLNCPACHGNGTIRNQNTNQPMPCNRCHGKRVIGCEACHQTGQMKCRPCTGTGRVGCAQCNASGRISDIAFVSFDALTKFAYDLYDLPVALPPMIDEYGPTLVSDGHAELFVLQGNEQQAWQKELRTAEHIRGEVIIPYHARLPWGLIRFRLGDEILSGQMLGFNGELLHFPPFLERLITPGVERLLQAANGFSVKNNLHESARTKIIATSLLAAATLPPKKAFAMVRKRYTAGIDHDAIERLVTLSGQGLARLTRLSRIMTLGAGTLVTCGFYAAWFMGGLRAAFWAAMPPVPAPLFVSAVVDCAWAGLFGYGLTHAARFVTRARILDLVRPMIPPDKRKKFMPRAGKTGLAAWGCTLAALVVILGLTVALSTGTPDWVNVINR